MVTHPPGHGALLTGSAGLVGLALDAQVHDVVAGKVPVIFHSNLIQTLPANCTVIHHNVPGPESHGVPLLHLEPLLVLKLGILIRKMKLQRFFIPFHFQMVQREPHCHCRHPWFAVEFWCFLKQK